MQNTVATIYFKLNKQINRNSYGLRRIKIFFGNCWWPSLGKVYRAFSSAVLQMSLPTVKNNISLRLTARAFLRD